MAIHRLTTIAGHVLTAWLAVSAALMAAEHHGIIKSGGIPLPGVTVTATQGEKKHTTTTDENGVYSFPDLADGTWKLEMEMVGFEKQTQEIGIAYNAPSPEWTLKMASLSAITTPKPEAAPAAPQTPAPAATASAAAASQPAAPTPAGSKPVAAGAPQQANAGRGGRGGQNGNARSQANNGRPSLLNGGFQRVDVNQSTDNALANNDAGMNPNEMADLSGSADAAFTINGSVSRGLDMPQQNDWFGGPGGRDGMGGFGPNGMGPGMNGGFGGDGAGAAQAPGGAFGGRGAAGPGGAPGGRGGFAGGGAPGGPGGFGGGRGFGGPGGGGGRGGRGARGPGRGGPMGRAGVTSFGNGRRDRRMQINGNASFTLDNSAWDARSYSINGQNTEKPAYAKARANMTLGGPLKIPKLLDGRRGTFNLTYSLGRIRTGNTLTQTMPTALERTGDFSQSIGPQGPVTIYDPTTGLPFPGNVIPSNRISPTAEALLKYYPLPNGPGYKQNYQSAITTTQNSDNVNARLNQTLNTKDRLNGGIAYMGNNTATPNVFNFLDSGTGRNINANVAWGHNFTPRMINNLRYTFSRSRALTTPFFANSENIAAELGILGTSQDPLNWGPPNLSFTNYATLSDAAASLTRNQTSSVGDSLIWIHGVHNITIGGDYRRQQLNRYSDPNARGQYTFTGIDTANVVNGVAASATGFDFADFLLGAPATSALRYGNASLYFRTQAYDAYITDDWRLSTRLSLNFGFRWDYGTPISELYNRMANLAIAPAYASISQVLAGQNGTPTTLVNPDKNNFSPRVGFAWRPLKKGTMVVRGGYGIYYNTSVYNQIANNLAQQPPFANTLSIATTAANPLTLETGFLIPTSIGATNTNAIDPNYRIGYAQIWQIAIQNNIGNSLVGTITYNGTKGTALDQRVLPNSAPPNGEPNGLPSGYIYEMSNGNSIYHAATFQLMRRFRSGWSANASYTFSKAIDDAVQAQNYLDTAAERALSATNRTHVANFTWTYGTGAGRGAGAGMINGWKGKLIKDWTFQNTITVGSGMPLTPIVGGIRSTTAGTGITGNVRADATGLSVNDAPSGQAFNYAAFASPAAGQWGNAGRDTITGPMQFGLNASLSRVIRVGERRNIDLRFDATNALNHVTYSSFNTTIGSNSVGAYTAASPMRSLTANLRFRF